MNFSQQITPEQETLISTSLHLAQMCEYPRDHTHQVTRLALRLFDDLYELHQLGSQERLWLHCASILHDIGWIEGEKGHHKASLKIIMNSPVLTFSQNERLVIGAIARYHRKALPAAEHDHFSALSEDEQKIVRILSAILRVADGFDCMHSCIVRDFTARVSPQKISIRYQASQRAIQEEKRGLEKSDLLRELTSRNLTIDWKRSN